MKIFFSIIIICSIFIIGCATVPTVKYESYNNVKSNPDKEGKAKFYLTKTMIMIDKDEQGKFTAKALPVEDTTSLYAILPSDRALIENHFKISYIDNTRILQSIGTSVEDNRIKIIETIGATGVALAKIGIFGLKVKPEPAVFKPAVIDVEDYKEQCPNNEECWQNLLPNKDFKYKIIFSDKPKDSVEKSEFFDNKKTSVLPYSACKDATLTVKSATEKYVFSLKTADPNLVQTIKFPSKGTITMHTSCGINVTDEKSESEDAFSIIASLIKQAQAIKEAQKEESNTEK